LSGSIRVLIVDDSSDDAELVAEELRSAGHQPQFERVDTARKMSDALDRGGWDAIIADYKMPGFSCLAALKLMQERNIDVPFIVVSGAIGEETAVEAMRAGAHDYVLKHNLTRLPAAVTRELREAQIRHERRQAIEAIRDLARRSAFLAEASNKLSVSLEYEETLLRAARVSLPEVADWCAITVQEEGATLRSIISHVDPQKEAWARDYLRRCPPDSLATAGAAQVIRSGRREQLTAESAFLSSAPGARPGALAGTLGFHSGACLPLVARGRTIGALTLARISAERPFPEGEVVFGEELAHRAAMALDNANLYREAREAIRARDEFLSVASHELNTPLATLTLQLDEILLRARNNEREQPDRGVILARRQVERLSRLVSNLLDVSRITSEQIQLRIADVDLSAITREVLDQFAAEMARAGCATEIEATGPVMGRWDPLRIEQVIANLLSNACKYGAGKPIRVEVGMEGPLAKLSVRDHGIGIAPADRERIFERFERAASARHYGGLGLGLYITRQVVEAHGGTIRVASHAGAGSTFSVELPLETPRREVREAGHAAGID
jgi:signal transduction histidine kinase/DNA-binding response OmpR family regulator